MKTTKKHILFAAAGSFVLLGSALAPLPVMAGPYGDYPSFMMAEGPRENNAEWKESSEEWQQDREE